MDWAKEPNSIRVKRMNNSMKPSTFKRELKLYTLDNNQLLSHKSNILQKLAIPSKVMVGVVTPPLVTLEGPA